MRLMRIDHTPVTFSQLTFKNATRFQRIISLGMLFQEYLSISALLTTPVSELRFRGLWLPRKCCSSVSLCTEIAPFHRHTVRCPVLSNILGSDPVQPSNRRNL